MRRVFLFTCIAGFTARALSAQNLSGTVRDSAGVAIRGALIALADAGGRSQNTRADERGAFRLNVAGAGRYVVEVRALGFEPQARAVVWSSDAQPLLFVLRAATTLSAMQVIGIAESQRTLHPGASALAGSVSVLSGEQIAREQVSFAQELLRKVPGVYRSEFNQGIVAGDIGIRGFNTESDIASTKLLIDGIPSNLNSGVSEMNALFPLEIGRIEVVRGTNDARFGLFNLAGNVGVVTAQQGGTFVTSRLQGGSLGAREAQLLASLARGGFSQTLFAGVRKSDGYRDHAALDKWSASGKWFYETPGSRVRVGFIARTHRLDTEAPGYLTLAESRATPRFSPVFSSTDGGTVGSDHGSLHVDARPTATLAWSLKAYTQHVDRVRFVRFTLAGAQQERIEDERQTGALSTVTWRPAMLRAQAVSLTVGADIQQQDNVQQRFRTVLRERQATLRDYAFTLDNRGGYLQIAATPLSRLQLTAGIRADHFDGDFDNQVTKATLPILDYGWIMQPKLSASLRLVDRLSAYANTGRGFQIGTGIASYGRTPLRASRNDGVEAGFVSTPTTAISLRAGVWRQQASNEVRLKFDNSGDSENIGKTRRSGVDIESGVRLPHDVSVWITGTSQRAVLVEPGLTNAASKGKQLNHVPSWTTKFGADWAPSAGVKLSAWTYAQGKYHLVDANDRGEFGNIVTTNSDISWRWRAAAFGVGVTNLFDRYSEYVWWDGTQTLHSPAATRSVFVTITLDR